MSQSTARRLTSIGVLAALIGLWQLASMLIRAESVPGERKSLCQALPFC